MEAIVILLKNLKKLREREGLNASELARRVGVSPQAICKMEQGGGATVETVCAIADALHCTTDELLGRGANEIITRQEAI